MMHCQLILLKNKLTVDLKINFVFPIHFNIENNLFHTRCQRLKIFHNFVFYMFLKP